jgi:hypothetical protein
VAYTEELERLAKAKPWTKSRDNLRDDDIEVLLQANRDLARNLLQGRRFSANR